MTFRKPDQKRLVLSLLHQREVSGSDVYKFLAKKGARIWPNHVYGTLSEMERAGLLKGRWLDNPGGKGPRKHLYSLSIRGKKEFRELIRESIDLLVGEYSRSDHTKEDVRNYLDVVKSYFGRFTQIGARIPTRTGSKIVGVVPDPDPLVCSPLYIEAASEALPNAALYVVKPPHAKLDLEVRPNLTVLDGWRHNMPLKDGFADWLSVQGFRNDS
ncbi:MAG: PadR family transcriptional regulator [Thaumarchaeota archaeon]|nr:PadR family transcriptional regulator [Nitrososphaerota archaeon]